MTFDELCDDFREQMMDLVHDIIVQAGELYVQRGGTEDVFDGIASYFQVILSDLEDYLDDLADAVGDGW